jgi:FHA domain
VTAETEVNQTEVNEPVTLPESGYAPGSWVAMTCGRMWLLADVKPGERVVDRCWQAFRSGATVEDVLAAVMRDGFRAVAGFALVRYEDASTQVVVRGVAGVEFTWPDGTVQSLRTEGGSDWLDRSLPGIPTGLQLTTADRIASAEAVFLPLVSGVVLASTVGFRAGATESPLSGISQKAEQSETITVVEPAAPAAPAAHVAPVTSVEPTVPVHLVEPAPPPAPTAPVAPVTQETLIASVVGTEPPPDESVEQGPDLDGFLEPAARPDSPTNPGLLDATQSNGWIDVEDMPWMGEQALSPVQETGSFIDTFNLEASTPAPAPASVPDEAVDLTIRRPPLPPQNAAADQPYVYAVRCPSGHLNEEQAQRCRICGQEVPAQQPSVVLRPGLGWLRFSNGDSFRLERGVILGRKPAVPDGHPGPRPNAVKVSDDQDVSRNHVEIRLDGWQVLVVDLGSVNGTVLSAPGQAPRQLRQGEQHVVEPGSIITLAPGVWILYEVAQ